ncbi:nucleoside monophosphate kinase [Thermosulfurimonas sp. F29]|uniref:nucleoside monophosphate kinase n=1 Tax=Thermosulfurimonas sp. F29 TaxID=2867247 RepID=UPI001C82C855|nr:nucleoside monophosphate kinase [Thermosulfurimonas sp. F29]MBX6422807.1 nucleoside monophosphate kinase [Thermosulfurimonas sp. F29]
MKALHLLGPTGSGKTPLGEVLEARGLYGVRVIHFDFGAELRRIAGGLPAEGITPREVSFIKRVLEEGLLLENEHFYLAEKILRGVLSRKGASEGDLLLLNGLPRHEGQARDVLRLVDLRLAVELSVEEEVLLERLRRDPAGDRRHRTDDTAVLVQKKLHWYRERTLPLRELYRKKGIPLISLSVEAGDTGETLRRKLLRALPETQFKTIFGF